MKVETRFKIIFIFTLIIVVSGLLNSKVFSALQFILSGAILGHSLFGVLDQKIKGPK